MDLYLLFLSVYLCISSLPVNIHPAIQYTITSANLNLEMRLSDLQSALYAPSSHLYFS